MNFKIITDKYDKNLFEKIQNFLKEKNTYAISKLLENSTEINANSARETFNYLNNTYGYKYLESYNAYIYCKNKDDGTLWCAKYPENTIGHGITINTKFNPLTFKTLRAANIARLPLFKNKQGLPAHSKPDGSDWSDAQWLGALVGEIGEYANIMKKVDRGDLTFEEAKDKLAAELADVQTYLDLLAFRLGIELDEATVNKWNEVNERVKCKLRIHNNELVELKPEINEVEDLKKEFENIKERTKELILSSKQKCNITITVPSELKNKIQIDKKVTKISKEELQEKINKCKIFPDKIRNTWTKDAVYKIVKTVTEQNLNLQINQGINLFLNNLSSELRLIQIPSNKVFIYKESITRNPDIFHHDLIEFIEKIVNCNITKILIDGKDYIKGNNYKIQKDQLLQFIDNKGFIHWFRVYGFSNSKMNIV